MTKDTNEVLKFLVFLFNMIANLQHISSAMPALLGVTNMYIVALGQLDADKLLFVLKHFYLSMVLERMEKLKEINQYFAIRLMFALSEINERIKSETLHLILTLVKSKEMLLKIFEVWTDEEQRQSAERPKEATIVAKGLLKETKLTTAVAQRAFFFKILINLLESDYLYVEKIFYYYEDMLFERHNEQLKAIIMKFLTEMYLTAFRREMQQLAQEKSQFNKEPKSPLDGGNKMKQSPNKLGYILKKIENALSYAGPASFCVFFDQMAELMDSSARILEIYVNSLLKHEEKQIGVYFEEKPAVPSETEIDGSKDKPLEPTQQIADSCDWLKKEFMSDDQRYSWIFLGGNRLDRDTFVRNSTSIISYLLKGVSLDTKEVREDTFWYVLRFCFSVCKFETLNFEYFDFIMNASFKLLVARLLSGVSNPNLYEIMSLVLRFEVKREVSLKDFEATFERLLLAKATKELMTELIQGLYVEMEDNDVYVSSFKARFGGLLGDGNTASKTGI